MADPPTLEETKDLIVVAMKELRDQQAKEDANDRYERQELRRWAVEQAVASKNQSIDTAVAAIVNDAKVLISFVKGEDD